METAFFIIATITVLGALGAALYRNVMHCALSLILFFFGIAGEFFLLRAEFIGAVQILVYTGAVGVLVLFAVMLTRHLDADQPFEFLTSGRLGWTIGFATSVLVAAVLVWAILSDLSLSRAIETPPTVKVAQIGAQMMQEYVIPFEVVGILLTAAMIGAIVIALEEVPEAPMIPLSWHLSLAAILFAIGLCAALTRRNAIIVLIGIEVMFNAANLNLIAFWRYSLLAATALNGQMFVLFTIAIAAAEAAVGLALVIAVYRHYKSVDVTQMKELRG